MSKETIYDRSAIQRVPMATVVGDEKFDIAFLMELPGDDEIIKAFESEEGKDETATYAAMFKRYVTGAEGCANEDDEPFNATALGNIVPKEDQAYVFAAALLTGYVEAKPLAMGKKLNWNARPDFVRHTVKGFYNGANVTTTHKLSVVNTAAVSKAYDAMVEKKFPVKFGDLELQNIPHGLCELYDALKIEATGYAEGNVPAHHKMIVCRAHFEGEREIRLGK